MGLQLRCIKRLEKKLLMKSALNESRTVRGITDVSWTNHSFNKELLFQVHSNNREQLDYECPKKICRRVAKPKVGTLISDDKRSF
jgi:hypothetical protein